MGKLSDEDLVFLEIPNKKKTNTAKGKGRRRRSNPTSTPAKVKPNYVGFSDLSPKQQAAIKYLGFPPEFEYVKNIISSHSKRK